MTASDRNKTYLAILKQETIPALGCTDPVAIALASAKARKALGSDPERMEVFLSRNMLKNAMGVGIPGTRTSGIETAAALGAFGGNADAGLQVLSRVVQAQAEKADRFVKDGKVIVHLKDTPEVLYIEAALSNGKESARVLIQGDYTRIVKVEKNEKLIFHLDQDTIPGTQGSPDFSKALSISEIWDFTREVPFAHISFLLLGSEMNSTLSDEGLNNEYGLRSGKIMRKAMREGTHPADLPALAVMRTSAAVDARMAGCHLPATTNSGSGNQGITITLPILMISRELNCSDEKLARSLALGHLTAIHIRRHFDRLSSMCGLVAAGTGAACGIIYLQGGGIVEITAGIANMVGNLSGMVCDGAKPGCALKASSAVHAAFQSSLLALKGVRVSASEGIVEEDAEKCIDNLGILGSEGMRQTDRMMLDLMLAKKQGTV